MNERRQRPQRLLRAALVVCAALVVLAGCGGTTASATAPRSSATAPATPTVTATSIITRATATPGATLDQRIDAYIGTLSTAQLIGQTLMLAVYANGYNANLDQALTQWHIGSAIVFPNYNGGPLQPTTSAGMRRLIHDLLADVSQGDGIDPSRTFGVTPGSVATYAGAFLDGLQQNGVAGTLKHWPGLGASSGNPDFTLPTVEHTQAQLNAIDFASFRLLLARQPGMIMVTHVIVPAYDAQAPASLSPILTQGILRGQLGYQGVVVTDAMDAQGLIAYMRQQGYSDPTQGIAEACVRAFLAGDDLIEAPIEQERLAAVVAVMTQAVASGRISQARLREAAHRIIALKVRLGLLTLPAS